MTTTDTLSPNAARSILGRFGIPARVQRGRVTVGEQRVPLRRAALARMLGVDPDALLTPATSESMSIARELGDF